MLDVNKFHEPWSFWIKKILFYLLRSDGWENFFWCHSSLEIFMERNKKMRVWYTEQNQYFQFSDENPTVDTCAFIQLQDLIVPCFRPIFFPVRQYWNWIGTNDSKWFPTLVRRLPTAVPEFTRRSHFAASAYCVSARMLMDLADAAGAVEITHTME